MNIILFPFAKNWISGNQTDFLSYEGFLELLKTTTPIIGATNNFNWADNDNLDFTIANTAIDNNLISTALVQVNFGNKKYFFDVENVSIINSQLVRIHCRLNIYYSFLVDNFKENMNADERIAFFIKKHCNRASAGITNIVEQPWLYRLPHELQALNTLDVVAQQWNPQQLQSPITVTVTGWEQVPEEPGYYQPITLQIPNTLNAKWATKGSRVEGYLYAVIKQSPLNGGGADRPPYALAPIATVQPDGTLPANYQYFFMMSDINQLGDNILEIILLPFNLLDIKKWASIAPPGSTYNYWQFTQLKQSNFPKITTAGTLYQLPYTFDLEVFRNDLPIFYQIIQQPYTPNGFKGNLAENEPLINQVCQKLELSNGVETLNLDLQNVSNNNPPIVIPSWRVNMNIPQIAFYLPKSTLANWYVNYQYNQGSGSQYPKMTNKTFYTDIQLPSLSTNWGNYIQGHQIAYNNSKILATLSLAFAPLQAVKMGLSKGLLGNLDAITGNMANEAINLNYLNYGMRQDESRTGNLRQSIEKNAFINDGVLWAYTLRKTNNFNIQAIFKHLAMFGYEYGNYAYLKNWYNRRYFNWVSLDYVIKDLGLNVNKKYANEIADMLKRGIRIWTLQALKNGYFGNGLKQNIINENMEVNDAEIQLMLEKREVNGIIELVKNNIPITSDSNSNNDKIVVKTTI